MGCNLLLYQDKFYFILSVFPKIQCERANWVHYFFQHLLHWKAVIFLPSVCDHNSKCKEKQWIVMITNSTYLWDLSSPEKICVHTTVSTLISGSAHQLLHFSCFYLKLSLRLFSFPLICPYQPFLLLQNQILLVSKNISHFSSSVPIFPSCFAS